MQAAATPDSPDVCATWDFIKLVVEATSPYKQLSRLHTEIVRVGEAGIPTISTQNGQKLRGDAITATKFGELYIQRKA